MTRSTWIALGILLALGAGAIAVGGTPSRAEEDEDRHIVYLSVTGEGPNAKAWYRGAPPAGVPVQDALDQFADQGYAVSALRAYERATVNVLASGQALGGGSSAREESFVILLER